MNDSPELAYVATADALVKRILATFEAHPEAATLTDAWALFKVPGFECDDIGPSLAQAQWALGAARKTWREKKEMAASARSLAKRRLLDKLRRLLEVPGARPWAETEEGLRCLTWETLSSLVYRIENQLSRSYEEGAKVGHP